jgi:hypothetical protein
MRLNLIRALLAVAAVGLFAGSSHAYIDPGTGMTFISGIGAFIAGMFAMAFGAIALTFRRWMALLKSIFASVKKMIGGRNPA